MFSLYAWTPMVLGIQRCPVTPESGERGLIQATLVGILVKPFEGSLFEIDVRGLSRPPVP